ncbi:hypothetical protein tinsulaeT_04330 [Thalassotalea insulae]|uniref:Uncharacterized protein n=1 Tax=Thalassotalea insulae TaxID=2056778 RepID=A0ABQ6GM59_9GAMM|nr:hypothetical protein [Thalassotalea insulae]GLX77093.1 hypothetical protein tinsulaeT_04330 [Thalassotalea insulae]
MKQLIFIWAVLTISFQSIADGVVVDKVYSPHLLPQEQRVEWRFMSRQSDTKGNQLGQRLGYGYSMSEYVTVELYLLGERELDTDDFGLAGYEFETRWMLTDQGQYWADWGLLFEVEKEHINDNWEVATGLLVEKEFGKTSLTVNLFAIYEWGHTRENEWESEARIKLRYRYTPMLQPAIELYAGEDFLGIGPAFQGIHRYKGQKQLKWEAAFISEITQSGKDHTLRFAIEYEF